MAGHPGVAVWDTVCVHAHSPSAAGPWALQATPSWGQAVKRWIMWDVKKFTSNLKFLLLLERQALIKIIHHQSATACCFSCQYCRFSHRLQVVCCWRCIQPRSSRGPLRQGKGESPSHPVRKRLFFQYIRLHKYIKPQREFWFKMWRRGKVLSAQRTFFNSKFSN